jgi:hypothetical protein
VIDLNFGEGVLAAMIPKKEELEKLKAIGYVGGAGPGQGPRRVNPDWTHINAVAYNADLDQVILSVHEFSEIWVIDHGTTTEEAASHKGGSAARVAICCTAGATREPTRRAVKDQKLFAQHNASWIPEGEPGEGHILVSTTAAPPGGPLTVDEIVPPGCHRHVRVQAWHGLRAGEGRLSYVRRSGPTSTPC